MKLRWKFGIAAGIIMAVYMLYPQGRMIYLRRLQWQSEFQISSSLAFDQFLTHVAEDPNGNFVVVWQSNGQDGSGGGIFGRRYNAAGVPQGSEFQINTTTVNNQFVPRVAMDAGGNFVVVWESEGGDGNAYGIFSRRYNSAGVALGGEFRVNTATANSQYNPWIGVAHSGAFLIAWTSDLQDGSNSGVYAQRYDSSGVALGGEFQVNTYTLDYQGRPRISTDSIGNFVIVWESRGQDGGGMGVYAQRYSAAGAAIGSEFRVNTSTTNDQWWPYVVEAANGDFTVVWGSTGQDGSGESIYAQRYDASGNSQGGEFRVNTYTPGNQIYPAAGIDPAGNFVIVWHSVGQDGNGSGAYGQRYSSAGVPQRTEFRANTYTAGEQVAPYVSMDSNGSFVITWSSLGQDGFSWGVFGKRYDAAGNPLNIP